VSANYGSVRYELTLLDLTVCAILIDVVGCLLTLLLRLVTSNFDIWVLPAVVAAAAGIGLTQPLVKVARRREKRTGVTFVNTAIAFSGVVWLMIPFLVVLILV